MIVKNVSGKIEPRIGQYFIQRNSNGKYEVMKEDYE